METIDTRIVPDELIVGISGRLCYVTYIDPKTKKLNSEKSWTDWSSNAKNPLKVKNKFSTGFKLAGVNGRWSRNASNSENMLIEHPLFNKSFEISMSRFMEIAKHCTITNGEFDIEMIMDYSRNILTRYEYEKAQKRQDKIDAEEAAQKAKNEAGKLSYKDQVPGKFYTDRKNNKLYLYLGTAEIDGETEALKYALSYAHMKGFTRISLFTDNLPLAQGKADDKILEFYNFEDVHLTWVPRELNAAADKESKAGQKLKLPKTKKVEAANIIEPKGIQRTGLRIVKKASDEIRTLTSKTYDEKIDFLVDAAKNVTEREVIGVMLGHRKNTEMMCSNNSKSFMRLIKTMFNDDELDKEFREKLSSIYKKKTKQQLKAFPSRDLKVFLQARKVAFEIKPQLKEARTYDMQFMIETLAA